MPMRLMRPFTQKGMCANGAVGNAQNEKDE
jgi:hypothetical protein